LTVPKMLTFNGRTGIVIRETVGMYIVRWLIGDEQGRVLKDIDGLSVFERNERGRPKSYTSNADKQRAYRERKAGKALRKYQNKNG